MAEIARDRQTGMRNGKAELCLNDCRRIGNSVSSRSSKTKGKARGKKEGKQKEMGGKDSRKTREEARKRTKQNKTKYTKKS